MQNSGDSRFFSVSNRGILSSLIAQQYGLPDPRQFSLDAYGKAFPQVLVWCSAVGGVLLVSLIVKSFLSRN